ncbi:aldo/keto reductase [candidate division WOR_3 bacterium SM23_60]|uniref:Aldo/keto reductase n=1 Tax=candidate division WOR_3 bacterium SM23_60 TaxID=1703780 RepID=A0A0S8GNJ8_UNCW3|nr:MAG: aldo/keto reductase [candidate division WOR_3 bacterium SM23_60]
MIYRRYGKTDIKISQLGFGCMRFPITDTNNPKTINESESKRMLHYAVDNGVNYLDTAYTYHMEMSERFVGKALKGGYRKKVYLATKMPVWLVKSKEDSQKYFDEQLRRLQTDRIDMYLLHSLGKNGWKTVQHCDILGFLDKMLKKGKMRFAGFSYHDELSLFKEIVDAYPWACCLIHLNYVDDDFQAGVKGLEYAHKKGLAVVIMEPLRGGKLARKVPAEVLNMIKQSRLRQTPAEFALRWLYNRPEVSCVLSGMSSMEQVKENITFASEEHVGTLSAQDIALYARARQFYRTRTKINCTQCGYCMPCSQNIPIPFVLELYNDAYVYNAVENSQWMYSVFVKPENRGDQCTECGECEEKCPQKIPIAECMKRAHEVLGQDL